MNDHESQSNDSYQMSKSLHTHFQMLAWALGKEKYFYKQI